MNQGYEGKKTNVSLPDDLIISEKNKYNIQAHILRCDKQATYHGHILQRVRDLAFDNASLGQHLWGHF